MRCASLWLVLFCAITGASAQDNPQGFTDPVALLKAVSKNYGTAADTFHIESISERTQNGQLRREWTKTYRTAIKGPGNLYRIETRSAFGSYLQVSDGKNEWLYLTELKSYVKRPVPQNWPQFPKVMTAGSNELMQA